MFNEALKQQARVTSLYSGVNKQGDAHAAQRNAEQVQEQNYPENPATVETIPGTAHWPSELPCNTSVPVIEEWLVAASAREYDEDGRFARSVVSEDDMIELEASFTSNIREEFDGRGNVAVAVAKPFHSDQESSMHIVTVIIPPESRKGRKLLGGAIALLG